MIEVVVTDTFACFPDALDLLLTWVTGWFQIIFAILGVLNDHRAMMSLRGGTLFAGVKSCDSRINLYCAKVLGWCRILVFASLSALLTVITSTLEVRRIWLALWRL